MSDGHRFGGLRSSYVIPHEGCFTFPLAPQCLWADIEQVDCFSRWWGWLEEFEVDGQGLRDGTVLRGVVVPPVPYRMRVSIELIRCEPPRCIDARVGGDLQGPAWLRIAPTSDGGSRVTVAWELEMKLRAMRAAARVAYPVLRWGHDRVVEAAVVGYRRHLRRERFVAGSAGEEPGGDDRDAQRD